MPIPCRMSPSSSSQSQLPSSSWPHCARPKHFTHHHSACPFSSSTHNLAPQGQQRRWRRPQRRHHHHSERSRKFTIIRQRRILSHIFWSPLLLVRCSFLSFSCAHHKCVRQLKCSSFNNILYVYSIIIHMILAAVSTGHLYHVTTSCTEHSDRLPSIPHLSCQFLRTNHVYLC